MTFVLSFFSCRHGVFRSINGGSGSSPHGKRMRTRSRHHLFLESKASRRACSTTKSRVLDEKQKRRRREEARNPLSSVGIKCLKKCVEWMHFDMTLTRVPSPISPPILTIVWRILRSAFAIFSLTLKILCVPKFRSLRQVRHSLFIYYSSIFLCLSECVWHIFFFFFKMLFSYSIYRLLIHLPATHFRVIFKGLGNLRQWLLFLHRYLLRWTICFLFYIDILGSITLHRW